MCCDEVTAMQTLVARRQFLARRMAGPGLAALAGLLSGGVQAGELPEGAGLPQMLPKARRVIWLTQAGAPSSWTCLIISRGCGSSSIRTCRLRCVVVSV